MLLRIACEQFWVSMQRSTSVDEIENLVDIMSANSILVRCDIIGTSRVNGIEAPVIYNFFPNAAPGDNIVSSYSEEFNIRTHHLERHFTHDLLADGARDTLSYRKCDCIVDGIDVFQRNAMILLLVITK